MTHSIRRRRGLLRAVAASPIACLPFAANAQSAWPSRPIRWIVAYPAGGGSDFLARNVSTALGKQLSITVVVDNRPGAAAIVGTEAAAHAPADGYTVVTGDNGAMVFNPVLYDKLPYATSDFAPVAFMARFPLLLVVSPRAGFADARALIDAVRRAPGRYNYASPGAGSPHHLAMELLKDRASLFVVHVPYRGTAPAMQDLMADQVPMMIADTAAALPQIRAGKVKALAVLANQRIAALPEVPTIAEAGVRGVEVHAWQGLFVPRGVPSDIVARLNQEVRAALASPEVKPRLEEFGLQVTPGSAEELAAFVDRERGFWTQLIRERGIRLE